jgi:hypothetical protein
MRSVIVHLWNATESDVAATLGDLYVSNGPEGWKLERNGDPYLYIGIYRFGPIENENWLTRFAARSGPPSVSVFADISDRHDGWPETQAFVVNLLAKFDGLAEDDRGLRFRSRAQVLADTRVEGHLFGDWRQ